MINKESIIYSLRNLRHNKSRSFLTILSIFVGITTIFIFISFGLGLLNYTEELKSDSTANKIQIQPKGVGAFDDSFSLSEKDLEAIDKTTGVKKASGVYFRPAEVKSRNNLRFVWTIAYDPKQALVLDMLDLDMNRGRALRSGDTGRVVLGYNYLFDNKIFEKSLELNDNLEIQGRDFKIIGFYEPLGNPQDDSNVYMINKDFEELFSNVTGYNWIIAEVDVDSIGLTIERVEDSLRKTRNLEKGKEDFFVQSFEELLEQFNTVLLFISLFVIAIALVSVLVSAINTANTMVTSTLERVKEIGVMKSVGAKNSEVFKIFLFESAFLGFIAGVIGVILGFAIAYGTATLLDSIGYGFLSPSYSPWLFVSLILFASITGGLSGVWPAWQASKVRPVEALRYE